jgi:Flp pilus assembly pilin Flp
MERAHHLMRLLRHLRSHVGQQAGAVMVEYVLIASIVAAGTVGGLGFLGSRIDGWVTSSGGKVAAVPAGDGALDGRPTAGAVTLSCSGSGCSTLTASLSGWSGATSYNYTWQKATGPSGCASTSGWTSVGSDSSALGVSSPGSYRVTVRASNDSGESAPVTTCVDV